MKRPIIFAEFLRILGIVFLLTVASGVVSFGGIRLDPGFDPVLRLTDSVRGSVIVLPDGKLLAVVFSDAFDPGGNPVYKLARLNADGSLNQYFDVIVSNKNGQLILQPDGKIVIGNDDITVAGQLRRGLVRLNGDGSFDASFSPSVNFISTRRMALEANGNILVYALIDTGTGTSYRGMRLFPNGQKDPNVDFSGDTLIKPLPGGSFLNGRFSGKIRKYLANGAGDTAFNNAIDSGQSPGSIHDVAIQPDGKFLLGGSDLARINPDGTSDTSFNPGFKFYQYLIQALLLQSDGKILVGGNPYHLGGGGSIGPLIRERLTRLNPDGSLDGTFDVGDGFEAYRREYRDETVYGLSQTPDGRILANGTFNYVNGLAHAGLVKLNANGNVDNSFNFNRYLPGGTVRTVSVLPDGKLLIGGMFDTIDGIPQSSIARLNPGGSVDPSFATGSAVRGEINSITRQPDGKILLGGSFKAIGTGGRRCLIRLNQNGAADTSLHPPLIEDNFFGFFPQVSDIYVQPDGKILLTGSFKNYDGIAGKNTFVRILPNGDLDAGYAVTAANNPNWDYGAAARFYKRVDGKAAINLTLSENGSARDNTTLLNTDGSIDLSFNLTGPDPLGPLGFLPDNRLIAFELCCSPNYALSRAVRRLPNGNPDPSFLALYILFDNKWVTLAPDRNALYYTREYPANNRILSLGPDGGQGRVTSGLFYGQIHDIDFTSENKIVAAGDFTKYETTPRTGIARFYYTQPDFDFDGDGKSDLSIFRPSTGEWWYQRSSDQDSRATSFGSAGDKLVPADFTGDGKTDLAVFNPATGQWLIRKSENASVVTVPFGASGDIPMPADYDGDGRADPAVFRPSSGVWYIFNSRDQTYTILQFGAAGDKPVAADYDGDGRADIAILRSGGPNLQWWRINSSTGQVSAFVFGAAGDKAVPGDYTGDIKADIAVWRPSDGVWYILRSEDDNVYGFAFGIASDIPAPADFDGDGKFDAAIFRQSEGNWYIDGSSSGFQVESFGTAGDKPIPNAFVP